MFVRDNIARMKAYVPGEQPGGGDYIKLNANENPYPPSPRVVEALLAATRKSLNLYPDAMANAVRDRLAARFGLARENFIVGNGGDDILTILTRCLVGEQDAVAYPVPGYVLYPTLAELQGARKLEVPFPADFSLPGGLFGNNAKVTFLANPNSTGTVVPCGEVRKLAESLSGVLVVDEAYVDFAGDNCMSLVGSIPNFCVLRSFSKSFSLAGMRVGYLAAPANLVEELLKAKDSYNVTRLSIVAAAAALDDYDYMLANVDRIRQTRDWLAGQLRSLGFNLIPSQANFLWAKAPAPGAKAIYQRLKDGGILVRFWDRPDVRDFVRITIGTREQVEALFGAVRTIIGDNDAG